MIAITISGDLLVDFLTTGKIITPLRIKDGLPAKSKLASAAVGWHGDLCLTFLEPGETIECEYKNIMAEKLEVDASCH